MAATPTSLRPHQRTPEGHPTDVSQRLFQIEGFMLLINIQRARAQYNDMLAEAEARRLGRKRTASPIARLLEALRLRRAARAD